MLARNIIRYLVLLEVALCFALPAYVLFWGILTIPLWLSAANREL